VQVHDRGARFDGADGGLLDVLGADRQMGDMEGVWIPPVTAQVMMTLCCLGMV
jgi:hypothetical protein